MSTISCYREFFRGKLARGATRKQNLKLKQVNVKQAGPAQLRRQNVKVLEAGKALQIDAARTPDANLPKLDIEVVVQGKNAK